MHARTLEIDDAVREIADFVEFHRFLYGIKPGTPQPSGIGEEWGTLKQRVYGTLPYERNDSPAWVLELNDPAQKAETLVYIRTKLPSLVARVAEELRRRRDSGQTSAKVA